MFDLSFAELAVIGAVALVVIGPEKLPKVARTAGMLLGRAQRMVASVKADLDREMRNADLSALQAEIENEAATIRDEFSIAEQVSPSSASPSEDLVQADAKALPAVPDVAPMPVRRHPAADDRQPDLFAPSAPAPDPRDRR
jgi:sec-independent protein translocase protein TatB